MLETKIVEWFEQNYTTKDASHDLGHFKRVLKIARKINQEGKYDVCDDILVSASYFHDIVSLPKNHPERKESSKLAAKKAEKILKENFSLENTQIEKIKHAIEAHSFSANIKAKTIEAKIIQDADRLEALGALGIARCFYISGKLENKLFNEKDFYADQRTLDDKKYAVDHFFVKLF